MKDLQNYYGGQLQKLGNPHSGYAPAIQIRGNNDVKTHWLTLSDESAQILVNWLNDNYNIILPEVSGINK